MARKSRRSYRRVKHQPWLVRKWSRARRQGVIVLAWIGAAALVIVFIGLSQYWGG